MISKAAVAGLATLLIAACQRQGFENRVWQGPGVPPVWALTSDFDPEQNEVHIGSEKLQRKVQTIGGIEVENTAQLEIRDENSKPIWISQRRSLSKHLSLTAMADLLSYRLRHRLVRRHIEKLIEAENLEMRGAPRLIIAQRSGDTAAELRVDLTRKSSGDFFEDSYDLQGERLDRRNVGAHFMGQSSRLVQVYPMGPKKSQLTWVPIFLRPDTDGLSSKFFTLTSQSGDTVGTKPTRLSFTLDDTRFDQVQVYYFVEEFLRNMKSKHGFELPQPLTVETHIGYPDKTNAAFYYRWVLRYGVGDGVTYQELMRDPTVVTHEVAHAVIDAIARLNFEGEAGSINEGVADFLAASMLKTPLMGEASYLLAPYRRSLETKKGFNDREGKLYLDSEIVSSFLWQLRDGIGAETSEDFVLRVLARLMPAATFADLRTQILDLAPTLSKEDQAALDTVLTERNWK